ncbi:hypothetical protein JMJ58_03825 [Haloterrigena salifodinae]|uniref:Uncharacterized protein n=1 Tax=Haloterrigena salifodinae TaxID=2675099 RepID=A0A8T8E2Q4_9EURY|nr:hypothetical protein [Haloterrigena salifodinae]QRV16038.1 hypothetical protein JMJ58_03825 [Haloterrigena salifodinae]
MQSVECPHCGEQTGVDENEEIESTSGLDTANPFAEEPESECDECGKLFAYSTRTGIF